MSLENHFGNWAERWEVRAFRKNLQNHLIFSTYQFRDLTKKLSQPGTKNIRGGRGGEGRGGRARDGVWKVFLTFKNDRLCYIWVGESMFRQGERLLVFSLQNQLWIIWTITRLTDSATNNIESWVRGRSLNEGEGGGGVAGGGSPVETEGGGICCTGHWSCTNSRSARPEGNKMRNILFKIPTTISLNFERVCWV